MESYDVEEGKEEDVDKGEDEGEVDERTLEGGSSRSPGDGNTHPFILPKM